MNQFSDSRRRLPRNPLEPREYMRRRRRRRLDRNTSAADEAKTWADRHGFTFRVNNEGHHWMWQKGRFVAEWWPSSANLVLNRNYERSIHAHDWTAVIPFLENSTSAL